MNLQETVIQIRRRLHGHRSLYERNEEAVRSHVVNPVLRSLGWDPEDPDRVLPNNGTQDGVPDYTLQRSRKVELFIEAKNLSVDVLDRKVLDQLARYTVGQGCPFGVVTNGNTWVLIRSFEAGKQVQDRVIWRTDIELEADNTICRKLESIGFEALGQIEKWVSKTAAIEDIWRALTDDHEQMSLALTNAVKDKLRQSYPTFELEDSEITDVLSERIERLFSVNDTAAKVGHSVPEDEVESASREYYSVARISLDGQIIEIHHAYDILVQTAEWLIKSQKLTREKCPVASGHKRFIVNVEPKHRFGEAFWNSRRLSNGLFVEAHAPGSAQLDKAKKLLTHCGVSPDKVKVIK